jgi:hypothetical protein
MRIYVYVSQQDPELIGFTFDEAGANCPMNSGHGIRKNYRVSSLSESAMIRLQKRCVVTGTS